LISDPKRELITALGAGEGGKTKRSHFIFEKGGKLLDKKIPVKPADRYGCHAQNFCTSRLILHPLVLGLRWNSSRVYDDLFSGCCCYVLNFFQCCCLSSSYSVFVIYLLRCCFSDDLHRFSMQIICRYQLPCDGRGTLSQAPAEHNFLVWRRKAHPQRNQATAKLTIHLLYESCLLCIADCGYPHANLVSQRPYAPISCRVRYSVC
jgi:hypothetical protein